MRGVIEAIIVTVGRGVRGPVLIGVIGVKIRKYRSGSKIGRSICRPCERVNRTTHGTSIATEAMIVAPVAMLMFVNHQVEEVTETKLRW